MKVKCVSLVNLLHLSTSATTEKVQISERADDFLKVGNTYTVYSFSIWRNTLNYLLDIPLGNKSCPEWFSAGFFETIEFSLPKNMYFRYFSDDKRGVEALWGYKELILDYQHYQGLIEMDDTAITIFMQRKKEMDEQVP